MATAAGETVGAKCDALLVDAPRAPSYELCGQVDPASLRHEPRGFVARSGKIGANVFAVGEVTGGALDAESMRREAEAVAKAV